MGIIATCAFNFSIRVAVKETHTNKDFMESSPERCLQALRQSLGYKFTGIPAEDHHLGASIERENVIFQTGCLNLENSFDRLARGKACHSNPHKTNNVLITSCGHCSSLFLWGILSSSNLAFRFLGTYACVKHCIRSNHEIILISGTEVPSLMTCPHCASSQPV